MLVDETKREVTIENPFEILRRQIGFFGKTEEHTSAVYLRFLDEDGYREKNYDLTFYSFSDFEPNAELQAYMHFEEDRGIIWKKIASKLFWASSFMSLWKNSRITA